jgi:undecaprenol kinase
MGAANTMDNSHKTIGFSHAVRGITYALKTQINMRIHFLAAAMALLAAWALRVNGLELLWIILAIFMVIITELINTAVEAVVDLLSPGYNPLARIAKDAAAGAVLLAALHSLLVAFFVFGRRIL